MKKMKELHEELAKVFKELFAGGVTTKLVEGDEDTEGIDIEGWLFIRRCKIKSESITGTTIQDGFEVDYVVEIPATRVDPGDVSITEHYIKPTAYTGTLVAKIVAAVASERCYNFLESEALYGLHSEDYYGDGLEETEILQSFRVTKKTHDALKLHSHPEAILKGWDVQGTDGFFVVKFDKLAVEKLESRGADMNDPDSIENVVMQAVHEAE